MTNAIPFPGRGPLVRARDIGIVTAALCLTIPGLADARMPSTDIASADAIGVSALPHSANDMNPRLEQRSRRGGGGSGSSGGDGGRAVPRGGSSGGSSGGGQPTGGSSGGGARTRSGSGGAADNGGSGGTPTYSKPREDRPAVGTAVERREGQRGGTTTIITGGGYYGGTYGGFYPWGWGGLGLGGYYGYYDPWGWGSPYPPAVYYDRGGGLKLKVTPREAEVYVDGYFAGSVDDYDGMFQTLRINPGPHRIEVSLDGYEPLSFDVRIEPGRTITFKADMRTRGIDRDEDDGTTH